MGAHRDFSSHCYSDRASDVFAPLFCYASSDTYRRDASRLGHHYLYRTFR